jgi:hypothetical protein
MSVFSDRRRQIRDHITNTYHGGSSGSCHGSPSRGGEGSGDGASSEDRDVGGAVEEGAEGGGAVEEGGAGHLGKHGAALRCASGDEEQEGKSYDGGPPAASSSSPEEAASKHNSRTDTSASTGENHEKPMS